jgi:hypothetical protein
MRVERKREIQTKREKEEDEDKIKVRGISYTHSKSSVLADCCSDMV